MIDLADSGKPRVDVCAGLPRGPTPPAAGRAGFGAQAPASPAPLPPPGDMILSLAWAVVESSVMPLVLLDGDLKVVVASGSFCAAFELDRETIEGQHFSQLGGGEWGDAPLRSLLTRAALAGDAAFAAFELNLMRPDRPPRQLILNAHRLNYTSAEDVRVILGVVDATEERAADQLKDEMLRETALLLREVRHRVANSLQIIASVLMQTSRQVGAEEARAHLQNAHHRIMAIAALERQLATEALGDVAVRTYITELCASLAAAMAPDTGKIVLEVSVDDSLVDAPLSISLGLFVTELVINAFKYAFPDGRAGTVTVAYASHGDSWSLSVRDDGVGYAIQSGAERPGLGTAIVQGLARQQKAVVSVSDAGPGTVVLIEHHGPQAT